jgi:hypothetical protein
MPSTASCGGDEGQQHGGSGVEEGNRGGDGGRPQGGDCSDGRAADPNGAGSRSVLVSIYSMLSWYWIFSDFLVRASIRAAR